MRYMTEKEIFELTDKLDKLGIDYDMEYIWDETAARSRGAG